MSNVWVELVVTVATCNGGILLDFKRPVGKVTAFQGECLLTAIVSGLEVNEKLGATIKGLEVQD